MSEGGPGLERLQRCGHLGDMYAYHTPDNTCGAILAPLPDEKVFSPNLTESHCRCFACARSTTKVARPRDCTMCRECIREPGWSDKVSLSRVADHFIFGIESVGMLPPKVICLCERTPCARFTRCDEVVGLEQPWKLPAFSCRRPARSRLTLVSQRSGTRRQRQTRKNCKTFHQRKRPMIRAPCREARCTTPLLMPLCELRSPLLKFHTARQNPSLGGKKKVFLFREFCCVGAAIVRSARWDQPLSQFLFFVGEVPRTPCRAMR